MTRGICCVLLLALGNAALSESAPQRWHARIEVKLEPSAPNPRDPAFLSALAASPLYTLVWVEGTDTRAVYELTGPATDYRCEEEIHRLRRNADILEINVLNSDSQ